MYIIYTERAGYVQKYIHIYIYIYIYVDMYTVTYIEIYTYVEIHTRYPPLHELLFHKHITIIKGILVFISLTSSNLSFRFIFRIMVPARALGGQGARSMETITKNQ